MVAATWVTTRYVPGGHAALLGIINCGVHVIMYTYYFLTAFKPELKNSLWWKKHITQVQLVRTQVKYKINSLIQHKPSTQSG